MDDGINIPGKGLAPFIVKDIMENLWGRCGIDDAFDSIDEITMEEITTELVRIVNSYL